MYYKLCWMYTESLLNISGRNKSVDKVCHIASNILTNHRYLSPLYQWRYYSPTVNHDPAKYATAGTIMDVKAKLNIIMGIKKNFDPPESRQHLMKYLPTKLEDLPPRTMQDSFASAIVPLSTHFELQEKYTTFLGNVRIGRLLEDMDLFAVYVAHQHMLNPKLPANEPSPYVFVTALVDKIEFTDFVPKHNQDVRISGHVSWVGKSSMEIVVWLEQKQSETLHKLTRALFVMAARDPMAEKSTFVNPLVGKTDHEKTIIGGGEERKKIRKLLEKDHLTKVIPTQEEQAIMHKLFLRSFSADANEINLKKGTLPPGCAWMQSGHLSNLIISQPENRNLHNKVFGGFLMRQAMELSFALGCLYAKYRPILRAMSDVSFKRSIDIHSLIAIQSYIVYTQQNLFEITAYAEFWNTSTGLFTSSNAFHFTYEVPDVVKEVYPSSYQEVMMYIDGRRHLKETTLSRKNLSQKPKK